MEWSWRHLCYTHLPLHLYKEFAVSYSIVHFFFSEVLTSQGHLISEILTLQQLYLIKASGVAPVKGNKVELRKLLYLMSYMTVLALKHLQWQKKIHKVAPESGWRLFHNAVLQNVAKRFVAITEGSSQSPMAIRTRAPLVRRPRKCCRADSIGAAP